MFLFIIDLQGTSTLTEISYLDNSAENEQNVENANKQIIRKKKEIRARKEKGKYTLYKLL